VFDALIGILLTAAICGLLAWLAGFLLRRRQGLLGCLGAGLFGNMLGAWFGAAIHWADPTTVHVAGASVGLLFTFVFAALVIFLVGFTRRSAR
jgi:hypothetical protein